MAEEELPYKYQLDKIVAQVTRYRADGIVPESFLTPTFLKYFPLVMELGVLTDVNWNNISGLFLQSPVLPMTYVNNEVLLAMSRHGSGRQTPLRATILNAAWQWSSCTLVHLCMR